MHDRRDGVEEGEGVRARFGPNGVGQRRCGQRPGGDDRRSPFGRRQAGDLLAADLDSGVPAQPLGHGLREALAIHRERSTGRYLMGVGAGHDQRPGQTHLGVQNADRVGFGIVRAEGVGADELGEIGGLVGVGLAHAAHLVKYDGEAGFSDLPRRFGTGQTATDDMKRGLGHSSSYHRGGAGKSGGLQRKTPAGGGPAGVCRQPLVRGN